jgi:hypothetical protein
MRLVVLCLVLSLAGAMLEDATESDAKEEPTENEAKIAKLTKMHKRATILNKIQALKAVRAARSLVKSSRAQSDDALQAVRLAEQNIKSAEAERKKAKAAFKADLADYGVTIADFEGAMKNSPSAEKIMDLVRTFRSSLSDNFKVVGTRLSLYLSKLCHVRMIRDQMRSSVGLSCSNQYLLKVRDVSSCIRSFVYL